MKSNQSARLRVRRIGGPAIAADEEIIIETPAGRLHIQQDDWQTAILRYAPGSSEPECVAIWGDAPEEPPED